MDRYHETTKNRVETLDTHSRIEAGFEGFGWGSEGVDWRTERLALEKGWEAAEKNDVIVGWQVNLNSLSTLLEMIAKFGHRFLLCGRALREIKSDGLLYSLIVPGDQPAFAFMKPLDKDQRKGAASKFRYVAEVFKQIGLATPCALATDAVDVLEQQTFTANVQWLFDQVSTIEKVAMTELEKQYFIHLSPGQVEYFPTKQKYAMFGEAVNAAFPSAGDEIVEASMCLGVSRWTASVFHLMRVLNVGLAVFGKVFNLTLAQTNWGAFIPELESKIRKMHEDPVWKKRPDCKEIQEHYSQAASHFGILKDAWRNYTMHTPRLYTEEQAKRIFENVKAFMQTLAEHGLHE